MRGVKTTEPKPMTQLIIAWLQAHPEGGIGAEICADLHGHTKSVQSLLTYLLNGHRIRARRGLCNRSTDLRYYALEHAPVNQPQTKAATLLRDEAKDPKAKRLDAAKPVDASRANVKVIPGIERVFDAKPDVGEGTFCSMQIGSYLPAQTWAARVYR